MTETVIAVDPGQATGLAWVGGDGEYEVRTIPIWTDAVTTALTCETIVVERYRARTGVPGNHNEPMWIIGALKYLQVQRKFKLVFQDPFFRKGALPVAREMKITKTDHELDALAHLLMYQRRMISQ